MKCLKFVWSVGISIFLSFTNAVAQIGPAEQLLSDDTIAVFTVPDWKKLSAENDRSSWGQLWSDPAMKPFRDNFTSNFQADFIKPLEKELGLKLADYQELLQGQVTLALTPPKEGTDDFVGFLVLIDSKDKSGVLATKLADLRKKWTDAGKEVQIEKIRDVEFSSVAFTGKDVEALLEKAFPGEEEDEDGEEEDGEDASEKKPEKLQLRIGQFKSLLIIGENEKTIEKLLARQSGGLVPPLAEKVAYQKMHTQLFRDSLGHGWVNVKPIFAKLLQLATAQKEGAEPGMPAVSMEKILPALGFSSIETIGGKMAANAEGSSVEFLVGAPEGQREGLLKMLTLEKKDAAPPAFVPADVTKFQRTRIDSQKAWAALESMLTKIDPSMSGLLNLMLSSAGKDKDPNFDLKKNLIGNLGDDFIQYEKAPKTIKAEELQTVPSLTLIGSPNAAQLLDALRIVTSLMPPPISTAPLKEREFLGRKIYSMSLAGAPVMVEDEDEDDADADKTPAPKGQTLSFASSSGYVAFSTDDALLEDFLRSGENPPKPLRGVAGLAEAAQKAGGMENGLFLYENQAESMRMLMGLIKNDPDGFKDTLFFSLSRGAQDGEGAFGRLFDLKLLPDFDRISKYLGINVASGGMTADGFLFKAVAPTPAAVRK